MDNIGMDIIAWLITYDAKRTLALGIMKIRDELMHTEMSKCFLLEVRGMLNATCGMCVISQMEYI